MKPFNGTKRLILYPLIFMIVLIAPFIVTGQNKPDTPLPEGVYLELNKEFYEALKSKKKTYSNNPSEGYLRDISVSSKFIVDTNLQIIKQQEEIIRLLRSISDKK